jgi:hypothetical protein
MLAEKVNLTEQRMHENRQVIPTHNVVVSVGMIT